METFKNNYIKEIESLKKKQNSYLIVFIITTILFAYSIYSYFKTKRFIVILICLVSYLVITLLNEKINTQINRFQAKLKVINDYELKKNREIDSFDDGMNIGHTIELEDLDIVGSHSLFQYMNMARSKQAKETLIQRFENTSCDQTLYLDAIKEISEQKELIISFISSLSEDIDYNQIIAKMNINAQGTSIIYLDYLFDFLVLASVIAGFMHIVPVYTCLYALLFHYLFSYIYNAKYAAYFDHLDTSIHRLSKINIMINQNFSSNLLNQISEKLKESKEMFSLISQIETLYACDHNLFSSILLNGLGSLKLRIVKKVNALLQYDLKAYIDALIQLEVIISLATPLILDEETVKPVLSDSFMMIEGKHPLIKECISNSYTEKEKVCIITGSNMSGKTSFLRMIGVNMILMNAGSYVFAKEFKAPIYHIYTSMRIKDDLQHGISTFYGELLRIKKAMDDPYLKLILIDEIFKGTNYKDRITGSLQVIANLQKQNAFTFITTHDFQLCESENVDNYYFKEEYNDQNITFDYKIHPGKNTSSNALYLMKKAGIIKGCEENEAVKDQME